jgi:hypothetical protein
VELFAGQRPLGFYATSMESTPQQRKQEIRASNILYIGLGVSLLLSIIGLLASKVPDTVAALPNVRARLFGMVLLMHLLEAVLYYAIRVGKRWARIVLLILLVLTILPVLQGDEETFTNWRNDGWSFVRQLISLITGVWALVLLFRKPPLQSEPITR